MFTVEINGKIETIIKKPMYAITKKTTWRRRPGAREFLQTSNEKNNKDKTTLK